jgi:hypothetical protein
MLRATHVASYAWARCVKPACSATADITHLQVFVCGLSQVDFCGFFEPNLSALKMLSGYRRLSADILAPLEHLDAKTSDG